MTEQRTIDQRVCEACGHDRACHFRDVDGVARCTVVYRGETTRGIIGLPWEQGCPCKDFVMPPKPQPVHEPLPEKFRKVVEEAFAAAQKACDDYSRPKGIMGGPCLNCGRSQPEHVHRTMASHLPSNETLRRQIESDPDDDPSAGGGPET